MANIQGSIKRARQNEKRRIRNRALRSRMRTFVRRADAVIAEGDKDTASQAVRAAIGEIDKVTEKGIIHGNNGARLKSRLMRRFNAL